MLSMFILSSVDSITECQPTLPASTCGDKTKSTILYCDSIHSTWNGKMECDKSNKFYQGEFSSLILLNKYEEGNYCSMRIKFIFTLLQKVHKPGENNYTDINGFAIF